MIKGTIPVMSFGRAASIAAALTLLCAPAYGAQSFVYVAESGCNGLVPCDLGNIGVYDAETGGLVAQIAVPMSMFGGHLALSPDGRRLYVNLGESSGGAHTAVRRVGVVDTTLHKLIELRTAAGGPMAVSRDGLRLFVADGAAIDVYDTATFALVTTITAVAPVVDVVASPTLDRLYTVESCRLVRTACAIDPSAPPGTDVSEIGEYDMLAGARATTTPRTGEFWVDVHVSRDGARVYATASAFSPTPGSVSVFNPSGWTLLGRRTTPPSSRATVDSVARQRSVTLSTDGLVGLDYTLAPVAMPDVPHPSVGAVSADEARLWVLGSTDASVSFSSVLYGIDLGTSAIVSTAPLLLPGRAVAVSPPGAALCNYQVDTTQSSWTLNGGTAMIKLKTPCAWATSSDAPWAHLNSTSGTGDAMLTLTVDPNNTGSTRTATLSIGGRLVTVTQAGPFSQAPFGFIDTPAESSIGVSGALNVSGWALDDVGVARVSIFRDPVAGEPAAPVFIGNATFVDGVRPDVQAAFPAFPNGSRAGWGLQILTNMLPGQGNGTFRLLVFADDTEGHTTLLGTRTFNANNTTATIPFGTIDTPEQGATVSGTIVNFGWALTPPPAMIPVDGSTIDVLIDGAVAGHPTYGFARGDVDALFPGYANSGGAVGFFVLDTTTLANGVHTIAWVVHDNRGGVQGIGSRFFTVDNP